MCRAHRRNLRRGPRAGRNASALGKTRSFSSGRHRNSRPQLAWGYGLPVPEVSPSPLVQTESGSKGVCHFAASVERRRTAVDAPVINDLPPKRPRFAGHLATISLSERSSKRVAARVYMAVLGLLDAPTPKDSSTTWLALSYFWESTSGPQLTCTALTFLYFSEICYFFCLVDCAQLLNLRIEFAKSGHEHK